MLDLQAAGVLTALGRSETYLFLSQQGAWDESERVRFRGEKGGSCVQRGTNMDAAIVKALLSKPYRVVTDSLSINIVDSRGEVFMSRSDEER